MSKGLVLLIAIALVAVMFSGCISSAPVAIAPTPTPIPIAVITIPTTSTQAGPPPYQPKYQIGDIAGMNDLKVNQYNGLPMDTNVGAIILEVGPGNGYTTQLVKMRGGQWYYSPEYPEQKWVFASKFDSDGFPYLLGHANPSDLTWGN